jgi:pilus assembly protein FimV
MLYEGNEGKWLPSKVEVEAGSEAVVAIEFEADPDVDAFVEVEAEPDVEVGVLVEAEPDVEAEVEVEVLVVDADVDAEVDAVVAGGAALLSTINPRTLPGGPAGLNADRVIDPPAGHSNSTLFPFVK